MGILTGRCSNFFPLRRGARIDHIEMGVKHDGRFAISSSDTSQYIANLINLDIVELQELEFVNNALCNRPFLTGKAWNSNKLTSKRYCALEFHIAIHTTSVIIAQAAYS